MSEIVSVPISSFPPGSIDIFQQISVITDLEEHLEKLDEGAKKYGHRVQLSGATSSDNILLSSSDLILESCLFQCMLLLSWLARY
ncbi:hypothetical protein TNCT_383031 [Trichonephila clavata]|uniref:Uncharacterized protein n=1 Tax=Trichonephila clavata TaxID=2740835 RepID=A0A8X6JCE3_TRICU|nr:hypothetical protein TNCT_383031 [Trichonephila clavata]